MTERLYYNDPFLAAFDADVTALEEGGRRLYLNRTAFYPTSGGQPFDLGSVNGVNVLDVIDEEDRIAHILTAPLPAGTARIEGRIDSARRYDHMQQHTGQHLLSAVFEELFSAPTLSFHLGQDSSTIDIGVAAVSPDQVEAVERRANQLIWENRSVTVSYEDAASAVGLRKASERTGTLRIVEIAGYDRSACGGTHLSSTAGIGLILIRKLDKIRGDVRVEFLCGARALKRARGDFDTLSQISRTLSAPLDETPGLVANLLSRSNDLEKARRKLAVELATFQGRQLYDAAAEENGLRRVVQRHPVGAVTDEIRTLAQSFTAGSNAAFLAIFENPPSVLLAISKDSGKHAGDLLQAALQQAGGRGGGNAQLAQGSVPKRESLEPLVAQIQSSL